MNIRRLTQRTARWGKALSAASCLSMALAVVAVPVAGAATAHQQRSAARTAAAGSGPVLDVCASSFDNTLDPAHAYVSQSSDAPDMNMVYGDLAYQNPVTGNTVDYMAQSITPSANYKVWTLVLHSGMKFSDGTPFNAAAVKFNIQRQAEPALGSLNLAEAQSLNMQVLNATTLKFTLQQPNTFFNGVIAQDFPFVGSPTAETAEGPQEFAVKPVGAGPFEVTQFNVGVGMTLVKNPYFLLFAKGQPYFKGISLTELSNPPQLEAAMETGTDQMCDYSNGAFQYSNVLRAAGTTKINQHVASGGSAEYFETQSAPFNNVLAREAVYDALENSTERNTMAQEQTPGGIADPNIFVKTSPFYDAKLNFPVPTKAEAQAAFNKYAQETGGPLTFTYLTANSPTNVTTADYIQSVLATYQNVKVSVSVIPSAVRQLDYEDGNYQMTIGIASLANPLELSNNFVKGGNSNYPDYNNPVVNAALAKALTTTNVAAQKADVDTAVAAIDKGYPEIIAAESPAAEAYNPKTIDGSTLISTEWGQGVLWGPLK